MFIQCLFVFLSLFSVYVSGRLPMFLIGDFPEDYQSAADRFAIIVKIKFLGLIIFLYSHLSSFVAGAVIADLKSL